MEVVDIEGDNEVMKETRDPEKSTNRRSRS
jgi:hypothetical protein